MTGWVCPKCGSVYAPFVAECGVCNGFVKMGTTTTFGSDTDLCPVCRQHRSAAPLTGCPSGSHYGTFAFTNDSQLVAAVGLSDAHDGDRPRATSLRRTDTTIAAERRGESEQG
jgi:hypothetical protein